MCDIIETVKFSFVFLDQFFVFVQHDNWKYDRWCLW